LCNFIVRERLNNKRILLSHCKNLGIFLRDSVINSTECQHWQKSIAYYILLERSHCQLSHKQEIHDSSCLSYNFVKNSIKKWIFTCDYYVRVLKKRTIDAVKSICNAFEEAIVSIQTCKSGTQILNAVIWHRQASFWTIYWWWLNS